MDYLVNNWPIIIASIAIVVVAITSVANFSQKPSEEQIKAIKEWLIWAVTEAEKALGSGTGKLKLRYVYDKFLNTYPTIAKFVKFEDFSNCVDEALSTMKTLIGSNESVRKFVDGDK